MNGPPGHDCPVQDISSGSAASRWLEGVRFNTGPFGLDCESQDIDPRKDPAAGPRGRIVCISLSAPSVVDGKVTGSRVFAWWNDEVKAALGGWLANAPVVGHNLWGFDWHMFRKSGVLLGNIVGDTLRMHRLYATADDVEHGLKALMKWWLAQEPVGAFHELFARRKCLGVEYLEERTSRRKVGEHGMVPTVLGGASSRLGAGTEPIPLSELPEKYPHLLPTLYDYATLDAKACLELYFLLRDRMRTETCYRFMKAPGTTHAG